MEACSQPTLDPTIDRCSRGATGAVCRVGKKLRKFSRTIKRARRVWRTVEFAGKHLRTRK